MNLSKFKIGCLVVALGIIVAPFVMWNVPVTKTQYGNTVIVGDYIVGLKQTFTETSEDTAHISNSQDKINPNIFDDLTPGVTTLSVIERFLDSDDLVSSSYVGGFSTKTYVIRNSDGSYVTLIFQNGVLASKDESGLH